MTSEALARCMQQFRSDQIIHVASTMEQVTELVREHSRADDLVLAMGAGDVNSLWSRLSANSAQGQASCQSAVAS